MKRSAIVTLIVLLAALLLFAAQLYGRERAYPWVRGTAYDHDCVQNDQRGEGGVDRGGSTGVAGTSKQVNIGPDYDSVSYTTYTVGAYSGVEERGTLNRSQYVIRVPTAPIAKAMIHLHATSLDIYHTWPTGWTGYWYDGDEALIAGLDKGYYQASLTGWVGGHPYSYLAQRTYELSLYMESEYGVTEFVLFGGSFGATVAAWCVDLWPERFTGAVLTDPIALSFRMDQPWSTMLQRELIAVKNFSLGWVYDPRDAITVSELNRLYYDATTPYGYSCAERMPDHSRPIIHVAMGDDVRQRYKLWHKYLAGALGNAYRYEQYVLPNEPHGASAGDEARAIAAVGDSLIGRLEYLQGKLAGYTPPGASDPGDYSDLDGYLYPTIKTAPSNNYAHEDSRLGHGSGGGFFGSFLVGDFDADADQEAIFGSAGGGVFMLEEGASPSADWTVEDPAGNGTNWIGDQDLGFGAFGLAYDADDGVLFAGTMDGRLYALDPDSGALLATSGATYGRDLQHFTLTSDLDGDGDNELWFRSWDFYDDGGGATIWCVEYDTVGSAFTTQTSTEVGPWCGNIVIEDIDTDSYTEMLMPLADGRVVVYELRGSALRPQLQQDVTAKADWFVPTSTAEIPYCPFEIAIDDEYLYVLTLPTYYWDQSDPYTQQPTDAALFYVYSLSTLAVLDIEPIESPGSTWETFDVHEDGVGDKWLVTCGPGPLVRQIGATGIVGAVTSAVTNWGVGDGYQYRRINGIQTIDLDADGTREIVTIDNGGMLNVFTCTWGGAVSQVGQTRNVSRCFAMEEEPSINALMLKNNDGYYYRMNPLTMAYANPPQYESAALWTRSSYALLTDPADDLRMLDTRSVIADFGVPGIGEEIITVGQATIDGETRGALMEGSGTWVGQNGVQTWTSDWATSDTPHARIDSALVVADFDLDGDNDLLFSAIGGALRCYDKATDGGAEEAETWALSADLGWCIAGLAAATFSGDTYPSIVAGGMLAPSDFGYLYLIQHSNGSYGLADSVSLASYIYGLVIEDLDGDGAMEIIVGTGAGHLYIFDEDLTQLWRSATTGAFLGAFDGIECIDTDGDGNKEIFVGGTDFFIKYELNGD